MCEWGPGAFIFFLILNLCECGFLGACAILASGIRVYLEGLCVHIIVIFEFVL